MHSLLVTDSETRRRSGVARWVDEELAVGSKIYYTGWVAESSTPDQHWLAGPGGARGAREALAVGQLELLDLERVLGSTGGRGKELAEATARGAHRALAEGWTRVAMSSDSFRGATSDTDATELEIHENAIDALVDEQPVTVLCQLAVPEETEAWVWERVGMHHRDLVDETWSASQVSGVWSPRGELDAYVARRFGSALHAALRDASTLPPPIDVIEPPEPGEPPPEPSPEPSRDLHVDLSGVSFMDVACAQMLVLAARSTGPGQQIVLYRPTRTVRRLIEAVGRPRTVRFSDTDPWA